MTKFIFIIVILIMACACATRNQPVKMQEPTRSRFYLVCLLNGGMLMFVCECMENKAVEKVDTLTAAASCRPDFVNKDIL